MPQEPTRAVTTSSDRLPSEPLDRHAIMHRLVSELGYSDRGASLVTDRLEASDARIQSGFLKWWNTGQIESVEVEGYDVQRLMREHQFNPIAAFLTLDWLIKEPVSAKAALARGHDRVELKPSPRLESPGSAKGPAEST